MAQQTINVGTAPNDGTGTPLRTAFQYTNSNFSELYTAVGPSGNNIVVPGNATITGDLTVDTSTLKVDSANNRVGVLTASPAQALDVASGNLQVRTGGTIYSDTFSNYGAALQINAAGSLPLRLQIGGSNAYEITSGNVHTWQNVGGVAGTAMTLNSTGLGVGTVSPLVKINGQGTAGDPASSGTTQTGAMLRASNTSTGAIVDIGVSNTGNRYGWIQATNSGDLSLNYDLVINKNGGNVGIGVTPSYKLDTYTTLQGTVTAKQFANRTSNKILVKRFFGITADTALFSVECGTAGAGAMAAFEINVFATGQKSGVSSDRQFYGKWYVTRNLAGTFTITSAFSSGSSGAFTVTASGTSLNVNGIFSVISDGSACVEVTGYIGGRDTVIETALNVTMP